MCGSPILLRVQEGAKGTFTSCTKHQIVLVWRGRQNYAQRPSISLQVMQPRSTVGTSQATGRQADVTQSQ